MANLCDVVDGALHAPQLGRLDVEHLQHVVGQSVDEVGHAGHGLRRVAFGLLQGSVLVRGLGRTSDCFDHKR